MRASRAQQLRRMIEGLAELLGDNESLEGVELFRAWEPGSEYAQGVRVRYGDRLWRCRQAHTAIIGWEPPNAASLWEQVCESHTGAEDDPIPYEVGMALAVGLYYEEDGVIYRCIRDTGNPVYHRLAELVGLYVERV